MYTIDLIRDLIRPFRNNIAKGLFDMAESEVRKRERGQEKAKESEDGGAEVVQESTEPPPPQENGTDYWDLDDDDQWGKSAYSSSEVAKRRKVMRRSNSEVGLAFTCHLVLMCYYIYVHVYDATIVKRSKGVGFDFTYGGRWKFLTYINLWIQFVFFFLCFFTDIMPRSYFKVKFQQACDLMFTTVALPMSLTVFALFWSIYAVDREFIYPEQLDKTIPFILNHFWHSGIIVATLIEAVVVFHRYPSNMKAFLMQFLIATAYIIWMVWVFNIRGKWPYPFMKHIPIPLFPLFCLSCLFVDFVFYFVGKFICYFRWRERHSLMDELGL